MKKRLSFLICALTISTAVSAGTYKVSPNKNTTPPQYQSYNVYTPSTYTSQQTQNGIDMGGIVEIVMDYSGSMSDVIDKSKYAVRNLYPNIPAGTKVGLRVFGQSGGFNPYKYISSEAQKIVQSTIGSYKVIANPKPDCIGNTTGGCSNTVQVLPVGQYNGNTFYQAMDKYLTGGATPLVFALHLAVTKDLANFPTTSTKKIILITDGGENCGGDPCEFAKKLVQTRSDIIIDVILIGGSDASLACTASVTGGKFYNFDNNALYNGIFDSILSNSIQSAPQVPNQETIQPQTNIPNLNNSNKYEYIPD